MSGRNLRESTKKVTEVQKEKTKVVEELITLKNTSKALENIRRQEEKSYSAAALELVEYTVEHLESDIKDTSEESAVDTVNVGADSDVFADYIEEVPVNEDWLDPLGVEKTPKESPGPEGTTNIPSAAWSTKINLFFPPNCESTPARSNRKEITSTASDLPSPVACLENINEESYTSSANVSTEQETSGLKEFLKEQSLVIFDPNKTATTTEEIMDESDYKKKLVAIQKSVVKVQLRIDEFGPDALTLADKDSFRTYLDQIRGEFEKVRDNIYDLITDLNEKADLQRIDQLKQIDKQLAEKFKQNDKAVKEEMLRLIGETEDLSSRTVRLQEDKVKEEKALKLEVRMKNHLKKTKDLNETIQAVGACDNMSEQEIRKNLLESKEWEKKVDSLVTVKEAIDEEIVGLVVDENLKTNVQAKFDELLDTVEKKVKELTVLDAALGLHTLVPSKVKDKVVYPEPFKGEPGEDVYKFVRDFKEAILADQVRTSDEVKTLVKHLKGEAKKTVGEHHSKLTDALDDLTTSFGNPQWIWQTLRDDLEKKTHHRAWGNNNTFERLKTLNLMLDFIRRAEALAKEHRGLYAEVYSASTISMIKILVPSNYRDKINLNVPMACNNEDKLSRIHAILDAEKEATLNGIPDNINYSNRKPPDPHNSKAHQYGGNRPFSAGNHDCFKSRQCNTDWDMLGCIELYKLSTVSERRSFLYSMRKCMKCGADFNSSHSKFSNKKSFNNTRRCKLSPADKQHARCTGQYGQGICPLPAALCLYHQNNASSELKSWLARLNMKFTVGVVDLQSPYFGNIKNTQNNKKSHRKSYDRRKLQTGESSLQLSDDEICDYFTADMRHRGDSSTVHPIPKGEPVFIFSIFQGKKGAVQSLIDSGANCWLAKDMVPQSEFTSMKLMDGPIPIGVASAKTVYATAEWASLIPLSDGSYQSVRGLTLDKVTGDMTELKLVPVFEQIKKENKSLDKIQNLKVPNIIGGEVQMILGIKYQNIYPEPVHTFPNGLTVFKSRLRPTKPGILACIGGPVEALQSICGIAGAKSTIGYMSHLIQNIKAPAHKINLNPSTKNANFFDFNIPGMRELAEIEDEFRNNEDQPDAHDEDDFFDAQNDVAMQSEDTVGNYAEGTKCNIDAITTATSEVVESSSNDDNGLVVDPRIQELRNAVYNDRKEHLRRVREASNKYLAFCKLNKPEPGMPKYLDKANHVFETNKRDKTECSENSHQCKCNHKYQLVQSEIEKYIKLQDAGLDISFKCPRCRNCRECLQGPGREKLSHLQETEQLLIKDSVTIDVDPNTHLSNNHHIAKKRLENICKKYGANTEVSDTIMKGFQKLIDRKHIYPWKDLSEETQKRIESAPSSYFIPWDVGIKETSVSTPARPTFDASSRTPAGSSLNDLLAKGNPDLIDLVHMVLNWLVGPVAICGDISQFYNTVHLSENHWQYQQVLWYKNMDITNTSLLSMGSVV